MSTTTTVTSAVLLLVALLAGLAVLVARSRRTRLATPEYVEPVPPAPAPLPARAPGEENPWTRQLLEALDNVIALDKQDSAPSGADDPRPGTDSPAHDSGADPEATAAWSPPFKSSASPGSLEALFEPADASPPDGLAEDDSEGEQVNEQPAGDDDDTRPGSTGDSTP
ncbi:hypothetical protein OIE67_52945 [Nonomuraea fuscirosea]|uniref:hypothetical protein n=1 Tax=Nonomuraea fuscirosea TaxID=1291556 RepID=UPI002DDA2F80|nr:hypothetical protein [Nonomuraea fuscirosea]WSA52633.1 hypothetical protein OIE67_52945 [Nonomuraea fuscirosea]